MKFTFICDDTVEIVHIVYPYEVTAPMAREKVVQMLYGANARLVKRRPIDLTKRAATPPKTGIATHGRTLPQLPPKRD